MEDDQALITVYHNVAPEALADSYTVTEDDPAMLEVLANDTDVNEENVLVIIDLSGADGEGASDAQIKSSGAGADVYIDPSSNGTALRPHKGTQLRYDPRFSSILEALPLGGEYEDSFEYTIVDLEEEAGDPRSYGDGIADTRPSTVQVKVKVVGANDAPAPVVDSVGALEDALLRIMADSSLAGTQTEFDTDSNYPGARSISQVSLLKNDKDPDSDDEGESLRVIGVLNSVEQVNGYEADSQTGKVVVKSLAHGLQGAESVLISGYGGHPSYNALHIIEVIDEDSFLLPVSFVEDHQQKGVWVKYLRGSQLNATSDQGAALALEIRADHRETNIAYNPRASSVLNGIASDATLNDSFYYAVEDRHGAISVARVDVTVSGANDAPVPSNDPQGLAGLGRFIGEGDNLGEVLGSLEVGYVRPASSGNNGVIRAALGVAGGGLSSTVEVDELWYTDEQSQLLIPSAELLKNDADVDKDTLFVVTPSEGYTSREGASIKLSADGKTVKYDPSVSVSLNLLARGERVVDSFELEISDGLNRISSLVAVLVEGVNDQPVADALVDLPGSLYSTAEDELLIIDHPGVLENDLEVDINSKGIDDKRIIVPAEGLKTDVTGVVYSTIIDQASATSRLAYDPSGSSLFDALAVGQSYTDTITYEIFDGSFVFAEDDEYKVSAGARGVVLNVLSNDRNLTFVSSELRLLNVSGSSEGSAVSVDSESGTINYVPAPGYIGDDVFTYFVEDELGNRDSAQVVIQVTEDRVNGNLQANDDAFTVTSGKSSELQVLANDDVLPAGSGELKIEDIVQSPNKGGVVVLNSGSIIYTPNSGESGEDNFVYEISGGGVSRAQATVAVRIVERENTLHLSNDDFKVLNGSQDNQLDVLANDGIIPDRSTGWTITSVEADRGSVSISNGYIQYTPNGQLAVPDTVTYSVSDGLGGTGTATATINMVNADSSPNASADAYTVFYNVVEEDKVRSFVLPVLDNDFADADAGELRITGVGINETNQPNAPDKQGQVVIDGANLIYTPAYQDNPEEGSHFIESFTYIVGDDSDRRVEAQVTITVLARQNARAAETNADYFTVASNSKANVLDVLANDGSKPADASAWVVSGVSEPKVFSVDGGAGGEATVSEGSVAYTPPSGFVGTVQFEYNVSDGLGGTATAQVIVKVGDLPVSADQFTVLSGTQNNDLDVLTNDGILPGSNAKDWLIVSASSDNAAITINNSTLLYTPDDDFVGADAITYVVQDQSGGTYPATATVTVHQSGSDRAQGSSKITVNGVNDAPGTSDLEVVLNEDEPAAVELIGTDVDQGDELSYEVLSGPANGTLSGTLPNLIYTPNLNYFGDDIFTYKANDGRADSNVSTVSLTVRSVNDAPVTVGLTVEVAEDGSVDIGLVGTDVDGDELIYEVINSPSHGLLSGEGSSLVYSPELNYWGSDAFTYRVSDGELDSNISFVLITVTSVNDAPVASDLEVVLDEDDSSSRSASWNGRGSGR